MAVLQKISDGLQNLAVGMGAASRDKFAGSTYATTEMSTQEIHAAYENSWIASKAIDIPADDATRAWRSWQASGAEVELIEAEEKHHNLRGKLNKAMKYARLWGGAALLFSDGTDPSEPIDPDRVQRGGLSYVQVLTRFDLSEGPIDRDIESPYFGQPEHYRLNVGNDVQVRVHPSRVVVLSGAPRADIGVLSRTGHWGLPILQRIYDAAKAADSAHHNIASLIFEAKVDVIKVPDLTRHLETAEGEQRLKNRFALASLIKGINGTLILDGEEDYQSKSASFATLPDILAMMLQIVSGAVDIPATRFMAQSPAGLNATGDADVRNYYDMIAAIQSNTLTPAMAILDECLVRSALGDRPPEIHHQWSSLWQMSEKDRADVRDKLAGAIVKLSDAGIYPPEILEAMHTGAAIDAGLYPGIEAAVDEHQTEMAALFAGEGDENADLQPVEPITQA